jgi:hypothetical protein
VRQLADYGLESSAIQYSQDVERKVQEFLLRNNLQMPSSSEDERETKEKPTARLSEEKQSSETINES